MAYKPIESYGVIGDLHTVALVGMDGRRAKIGDYAEVARMVRNLVHPARYVADYRGRRVTAKYLQRQFEVALLCRDWLAAHNNKSLREHMQREGLL